METVLVVNGYVRANAGDAALMDVCLQQAKQAYPHASVLVASMEDPAQVPQISGSTNIGSIRRFVSDDRRGLPVRLMRRMLGVGMGIGYLLSPWLATTLFLRWLPREVRREAEVARDANVVISMGGGYVHGRAGLAGWQNLYFVLLPLLIAQRHRRLTAFAPQSFGPFEGGPWQERLVRLVMSRASLVVAREANSVRALQRCGVPDAQITRGVDSAFSLDSPPPRAEPTRRLPGSTVGVTARAWLPQPEQHRYELGIARTIDFLQDRGYHVVLVPQVTADFMHDDDRIVESRIEALCSTRPLRLDDRLPYAELLEIYSQCTLFIGTRFHSVIFSLLNRVPCAAVEYEYKTSGIMADLGLRQWTIPISEVEAERLIGLVEQLIREREHYLAHLDSVLPAYMARSRAFVAQLQALDPHPAPVRDLHLVGGDERARI